MCVCVWDKEIRYWKREEWLCRRKDAYEDSLYLTTSLFFFSPLPSLISERRLALAKISQAASSHFQAASSILPLINKVNLFPHLFIYFFPEILKLPTALLGFFFSFFFSFHRSTIYISPANWQKALFIYQIHTATQPYYKSPLICHISFQ